MKRLLVIATALLLAACSSMPSWVPGSGWTTLIDGDKGLENFQRVGDANWRAEGGAIVADKAATARLPADQELVQGFPDPRRVLGRPRHEQRHLHAHPGSEKDRRRHLLRGEHLRSAPRAGIRHRRDRRLRQGAGAPPYKAGGKWNTFLITAKGSQLTVEFNGQKTVDIQDAKFAQGPFALQFGNHGKVPGAPIKWRKVEVRPL